MHPGCFLGETPGRFIHKEVADERGIIAGMAELFSVISTYLTKVRVEYIWEIAVDLR